MLVKHEPPSHWAYAPPLPVVFFVLAVWVKNRPNWQFPFVPWPNRGLTSHVVSDAPRGASAQTPSLTTEAAARASAKMTTRHDDHVAD
jgi:hypothetical protein